MGKLALNGGPPVVKPGEIEEIWPVVSEDDLAAVAATLRSGRLSWIHTERLQELEEAWAKAVGVRFCIGLNSGTAALHAAVAAVEVEPGDEVIVPALSFLATATAVLHHQGIPVFVDVDPQTFNIDPEQIEAQISHRTRAIIAVHLHGLPASMDAIKRLAARHGLKVIEDAAQAPGASFQGTQVGALGDVAAFSIMAGKNLPTAGEGGLLTTDDEALRDRADSVKMFGELWRPGEERRYNAATLGWNYRLSPLLAAFAHSQLRVFSAHTEQVQAGALALSRALAEIPGLIPPHVPADRTHVYHLFRFKVDPQAAGLELATGVFRKALQAAMAAEGVPLIEYQNRPLPGQTLFQRREGYGKGCPWSCSFTDRRIEYRSEDHPQTLEVIRSSLLVGRRLCMASFRSPRAIALYADAFRKVSEHRDELIAYARTIEYREPWEEEARLW